MKINDLIGVINLLVYFGCPPSMIYTVLAAIFGSSNYLVVLMNYDKPSVIALGQLN